LRSTTTQRQRRTLLVAFARYVAGGDCISWGGPQTPGGELEIEAVVTGPDYRDTPADSLLRDGTQPTRRGCRTSTNRLHAAVLTPASSSARTTHRSPLPA